MLKTRPDSLHYNSSLSENPSMQRLIGADQCMTPIFRCAVAAAGTPHVGLRAC